jgi:hypothetical protein
MDFQGIFCFERYLYIGVFEYLCYAFGFFACICKGDQFLFLVLGVCVGVSMRTMFLFTFVRFDGEAVVV